MEQSSFSQALRDACMARGIKVSEQGLRTAWEHASLLAQWEPRLNLVSVGSLQELVERHFLEGILAATLLPEPATPPRTLLDVGSGAGFPGLACRILRPDLALTLLEPRARRGAFLSQVAATQPQPVPRVVVSTLEDFRAGNTWDAVTFRAVRLPVARLLELLAPDGVLVSFPGSGEGSGGDLSSAELVPVARVALAAPGREAVAWRRTLPAAPGPRSSP